MDNHPSRKISNQKAYSVQVIRPLPHQHIRGISIKVVIKGQGTVKWNIEDDNGRVRILEIKDEL